MTPEEQEILIGELEKDIDRLHALYNQYFMGIEKMEPLVVRKNLERKIHLLRREQIKNTALRFRMQMQIQKYNTQCAYWTRICRQIEDGTYNRQVMLAKKRINARHPDDATGGPVSETDVLHSQSLMEDSDPGRIDIDLSSFSIDLDDPFASNDHFDSLSKLLSGSSQTSVPTRLDGFRESMDLIDDPFGDSGPNLKMPKATPIPKPTGNKPSPPSPTAPKKTPALDEEQAQSVYRRYLAARKKCNEPIDNISFAGVVKSLNAKLKAEGGKVEFKVVIREGKAIIKTVKLSDVPK
jgi:hypothetical protein